jgi:hypothetical protein
MARLIQTVTVKMLPDNHEEALAAIKRYKKYMEGKGATVTVAFALEAGPWSGHATVATTFPNAVAWAKLADDESSELAEVRKRALQGTNVVSASLLQEINLS